MTHKHHICVCICSYRRPYSLAHLLRRLNMQETDELFDYSLVIVDNDQAESAREVVDSFARQSPHTVGYYVEPEQNIALARNKAVAHAYGEFLAFIDDDEWPITDWLLCMYRTVIRYGVDGVLGPVEARFLVPPPPWMIRAEVFDRPTYRTTGTVINWRQTGMGNVLVRQGVLTEVDGPFDRRFGSGGEDVDFFRRAIALGKVFVWCREAIVYETISVERTRLSFQLRRALLRGKASLTSPSGNAIGILKSMLAFALYTVSLPFLLIRGRHVFTKYLVKSCDHLGKLLAASGIDLVKDRYVLK